MTDLKIHKSSYPQVIHRDPTASRSGPSADRIVQEVYVWAYLCKFVSVILQEQHWVRRKCESGRVFEPIKKPSKIHISWSDREQKATWREFYTIFVKHLRKRPNAIVSVCNSNIFISVHVWVSGFHDTPTGLQTDEQEHLGGEMDERKVVRVHWVFPMCYLHSGVQAIWLAFEWFWEDESNVMPKRTSSYSFILNPEPVSMCLSSLF